MVSGDHRVLQASQDSAQLSRAHALPRRLRPCLHRRQRPGAILGRKNINISTIKFNISEKK
jgi:hypothetical protein